MQTALIAGEQVLVMLMLMAVGFTLYKLKMMSDETCVQLNRIALTVVTVSVLISSYNREFDPVMFRDIGLGVLFSTAAYAIGTGLSFLLIHGKDEVARAERFAAIISNCGFMGIPLVNALIGPDGVIYASCSILVLQIYQWTIGRAIISGKFERKGLLKRMLLNPGTIGCAAGILLFVAPFTLPRPIGTAVDYIGSLNTPLAMIVIGTSVARTPAIRELKNPRTYLVCAVRLILTPLAALPLLNLLSPGSAVSFGSFIVAACPCAATSALLPALFGMKEAEKRGAGLVTVSTVLSVATIPLMVLVRELIGGWMGL